MMKTNAIRGSQAVRTSRILRSISAGVLVAFVNLTLHPLALAIQADPRAKATSAPARPADERYAEALEALKLQAEKVARLQATGAAAADEAHAVKDLRSLARDVEALEPEVDAQLDAIGRHLAEHNIALDIKQRHEEAKRLLKDKQGGMKRLVAEIDAGDDANDRGRRVKGVNDVAAYLKAHSTVRRGTPLDPNNLPWRTPRAEIRAPIETEAGFKSARFGHEPLKVAGALPWGTALPVQLSAQPGADDLAPTEDVQITPAIRELAVSLDKSPLKIYHWVRNNIDYVPTYGSIQGSDFTLRVKRGNAFDISSLLIALLRASDIPARYAYATIDVPADAVKNWVGGATTLEAALNLMGQGGIPRRVVTSGGVVSAVRMEHIYVNAWIDFVPSRGARHVAGDTWVPLDASFKQYTDTPGMNLNATMPFNSQALYDAAIAGATVSAADGYVEGMNLAGVQSRVQTTRTDVKAYIDAQKPNATIADALGTRRIIAANDPAFAGSLPYRLVVRGSTFAQLPDGLRHKFQYVLYASTFERSLETSVFDFQRSLPALAGKDVTLTFRPASPADEALIASYWPSPAQGGMVDPTRIPAGVSAYARVVAELKVEGSVVAQGGAFTIGTELAGRGGFTQYDLSGWDLTNDDSLVAGQATAIGINAQGIGAHQLDAVRARLATNKADLDAGRYGNVNSATLGGDVLTAAIWGYFSRLDSSATIAQKRGGVVDLPGLSYGLFHNMVTPIKLFGFLTVSVRFSGLNMDVGHLRHLRVAKNNDRETWIAYNRMRGQFASLMENVVPEELFNDMAQCRLPTEPVSAAPLCQQGVSATRAIGLAQSQGQRVYAIDSTNVHAVDQLLLRPDSVEDVRSAVAAGKQVTVNQRYVSAYGWRVAGIIIIDPETGAGAYLIEGGANGGMNNGIVYVLGMVQGLSAAAVLAMGVFLAGLAVSGGGLLLALILAIVIVNIILFLVNMSKLDDESAACYAGGYTTGFGWGSIFGIANRALAVIVAILAAIANQEMSTSTRGQCGA